MSRTCLFKARNIVRFEPTRETFLAELPGIYGYAPHILARLMEDVQLDTPKIVYGYQDYFIATRTEINKNVICAINYKLVKIGDIIEINSPEFAKDGHQMVVRHKSNLSIKGNLVDDPKTSVKISANSIKFLPLTEPLIPLNELRAKFKVGALCLIGPEMYRPRYEEGAIFRVVAAGSKYVRVEPIEPKFQLFRRKPSYKEKKINSFTYEKDTRQDGREFYYSKSVYNMDIPFESLKEVQEVFGEEVGNLICDFTELGI